jgi:transposase
MLKVEQFEFIRTSYRVYGLSISEIARKTGHSRNTIRKILRNEHSGYATRKQQPMPALEGFAEVIDSWLEQDKQRPPKQRHTARRIFRRLVHEHGFQGSESAVRRYVRQAKTRIGLGAKGAFVPAEPDAGLEAEVDWGDFKAYIAGKLTPLKLFCMRSKYSSTSFVRAYPVERQQALIDAHMQAFSFFGGIFPTLIYDNMTTAVQKILRGKKRIEQDGFAKFRAYYTFDSVFCNPRAAHEKGGVEGLVGYARRNFLTPVPEVDSLQELNDSLLSQCLFYKEQHIVSGQEYTVGQRFEHEKHRLLDLPAQPYSNTISQSGKVNHYGTVITDKNHYSVPSRYAGLKVHLSLGAQQVEIFYDGRRIACHDRVYGNNKWVLDPDHYLDLLQSRPSAFSSAKPIKQWRAEWPASFERLLQRLRQAQGTGKGTKDFISVLKLYREHASEDVERAVQRALDAGVSSGDAVRHLLRPQISEPVSGPVPGWNSSAPADISVYGELGGVS